MDAYCDGILPSVTSQVHPTVTKLLNDVKQQHGEGSSLQGDVNVFLSSMCENASVFRRGAAQVEWSNVQQADQHSQMQAHVHGQYDHLSQEDLSKQFKKASELDSKPAVELFPPDVLLARTMGSQTTSNMPTQHKAVLEFHPAHMRRLVSVKYRLMHRLLRLYHTQNIHTRDKKRFFIALRILDAEFTRVAGRARLQALAHAKETGMKSPKSGLKHKEEGACTCVTWGDQQSVQSYHRDEHREQRTLSTLATFLEASFATQTEFVQGLARSFLHFTSVSTPTPSMHEATPKSTHSSSQEWTYSPATKVVLYQEPCAVTVNNVACNGCSSDGVQGGEADQPFGTYRLSSTERTVRRNQTALSPPKVILCYHKLSSFVSGMNILKLKEAPLALERGRTLVKVLDKSFEIRFNAQNTIISTIQAAASTSTIDMFMFARNVGNSNEHSASTMTCLPLQRGTWMPYNRFLTHTSEFIAKGRYNQQLTPDVYREPTLDSIHSVNMEANAKHHSVTLDPLLWTSYQVCANTNMQDVISTIQEQSTKYISTYLTQMLVSSSPVSFLNFDRNEMKFMDLPSLVQWLPSTHADAESSGGDNQIQLDKLIKDISRVYGKNALSPHHYQIILYLRILKIRSLRCRMFSYLNYLRSVERKQVCDDIGYAAPSNWVADLSTTGTTLGSLKRSHQQAGGDEVSLSLEGLRLSCSYVLGGASESGSVLEDSLNSDGSSIMCGNYGINPQAENIAIRPKLNGQEEYELDEDIHVLEHIKSVQNVYYYPAVQDLQLRDQHVQAQCSSVAETYTQGVRARTTAEWQTQYNTLFQFHLDLSVDAADEQNEKKKYEQTQSKVNIALPALFGDDQDRFGLLEQAYECEMEQIRSKTALVEVLLGSYEHSVVGDTQEQVAREIMEVVALQAGTEYIDQGVWFTAQYAADINTLEWRKEVLKQAQHTITKQQRADSEPLEGWRVHEQIQPMEDPTVLITSTALSEVGVPQEVPVHTKATVQEEVDTTLGDLQKLPLLSYASGSSCGEERLLSFYPVLAQLPVTQHSMQEQWIDKQSSSWFRCIGAPLGLVEEAMLQKSSTWICDAAGTKYTRQWAIQALNQAVQVFMSNTISQYRVQPVYNEELPYTEDTPGIVAQCIQENNKNNVLLKAIDVFPLLNKTSSIFSWLYNTIQAPNMDYRQPLVSTSQSLAQTEKGLSFVLIDDCLQFLPAAWAHLDIPLHPALEELRKKYQGPQEGYSTCASQFNCMTSLHSVYTATQRSCILQRAQQVQAASVGAYGRATQACMVPHLEALTGILEDRRAKDLFLASMHPVLSALVAGESLDSTAGEAESQSTMTSLYIDCFQQHVYSSIGPLFEPVVLLARHAHLDIDAILHLEAQLLEPTSGVTQMCFVWNVMESFWYELTLQSIHTHLEQQLSAPLDDMNVLTQPISSEKAVLHPFMQELSLVLPLSNLHTSSTYYNPVQLLNMPIVTLQSSHLVSTEYPPFLQVKGDDCVVLKSKAMLELPGYRYVPIYGLVASTLACTAHVHIPNTIAYPQAMLDARQSRSVGNRSRGAVLLNQTTHQVYDTAGEHQLAISRRQSKGCQSKQGFLFSSSLLQLLPSSHVTEMVAHICEKIAVPCFVADSQKQYGYQRHVHHAVLSETSPFFDAQENMSVDQRQHYPLDQVISAYVAQPLEIETYVTQQRYQLRFSSEEYVCSVADFWVIPSKASVQAQQRQNAVQPGKQRQEWLKLSYLVQSLQLAILQTQATENLTLHSLQWCIGEAYTHTDVLAMKIEPQQPMGVELTHNSDLDRRSIHVLMFLHQTHLYCRTRQTFHTSMLEGRLPGLQYLTSPSTRATIVAYLQHGLPSSSFQHPQQQRAMQQQGQSLPSICQKDDIQRVLPNHRSVKLLRQKLRGMKALVTAAIAYTVRKVDVPQVSSEQSGALIQPVRLGLQSGDQRDLHKAVFGTVDKSTGLPVTTGFSATPVQSTEAKELVDKYETEQIDVRIIDAPCLYIYSTDSASSNISEKLPHAASHLKTSYLTAEKRVQNWKPMESDASVLALTTLLGLYPRSVISNFTNTQTQTLQYVSKQTRFSAVPLQHGLLSPHNVYTFHQSQTSSRPVYSEVIQWMISMCQVHNSAVWSIQQDTNISKTQSEYFVCDTCTLQQMPVTTDPVLTKQIHDSYHAFISLHLSMQISQKLLLPIQSSDLLTSLQLLKQPTHELSKFQYHRAAVYTNKRHQFSITFRNLFNSSQLPGRSNITTWDSFIPSVVPSHVHLLKQVAGIIPSLLGIYDNTKYGRMFTLDKLSMPFSLQFQGTLPSASSIIPVHSLLMDMWNVSYNIVHSSSKMNTFLIHLPTPTSPIVPTKPHIFYTFSKKQCRSMDSKKSKWNPQDWHSLSWALGLKQLCETTTLHFMQYCLKQDTNHLLRCFKEANSCIYEPPGNHVSISHDAKSAQSFLHRTLSVGALVLTEEEEDKSRREYAGMCQVLGLGDNYVYNKSSMSITAANTNSTISSRPFTGVLSTAFQGIVNMLVELEPHRTNASVISHQQSRSTWLRQLTNRIRVLKEMLVVHTEDDDLIERGKTEKQQEYLQNQLYRVDLVPKNQIVVPQDGLQKSLLGCIVYVLEGTKSQNEPIQHVVRQAKAQKQRYKQYTQMNMRNQGLYYSRYIELHDERSQKEAQCIQRGEGHPAIQPARIRQKAVELAEQLLQSSTPSNLGVQSTSEQYLVLCFLKQRVHQCANVYSRLQEHRNKLMNMRYCQFARMTSQTQEVQTSCQAMESQVYEQESVNNPLNINDFDQISQHVYKNAIGRKATQGFLPEIKGAVLYSSTLPSVAHQEKTQVTHYSTDMHAQLSEAFHLHVITTLQEHCHSLQAFHAQNAEHQREQLILQATEHIQHLSKSSENPTQFKQLVITMVTKQFHFIQKYTDKADIPLLRKAIAFLLPSAKKSNKLLPFLENLLKNAKFANKELACLFHETKTLQKAVDCSQKEVQYLATWLREKKTITPTFIREQTIWRLELKTLVDPVTIIDLINSIEALEAEN